MTAPVKSISCGPAQCFYQVAVAKCEVLHLIGVTGVDVIGDMGVEKCA